MMQLIGVSRPFECCGRDGVSTSVNDRQHLIQEPYRPQTVDPSQLDHMGLRFLAI